VTAKLVYFYNHLSSIVCSHLIIAKQPLFYTVHLPFLSSLALTFLVGL